MATRREAPANPVVRAVGARYVFPVVGEPLGAGVVTIRGERVVAVGGNESGQPVEDLGNVAILPGLVNAHTHLEFSALRSPLAEPGTPFADWIRKVPQYRIARDRAASTNNRGVPQRSGALGSESRPAGGAEEAIAAGLWESVRSGTTSIGEVGTGGWPGIAQRPDLEPGPVSDWMSTSAGTAMFPAAIFPDVTVFMELIALAAERNEERIASAERFLAEHSARRVFRAGLSPHASYTVNRDLVERCVTLSQRFGVPLAMHLAESREELELLGSQSGPLRGMLAEFGAVLTGEMRPRGRVLDYLRLLSAAHRALVIHGNYLDREEMAFLAENSHRMSVIYCPRTHDYFRHEPYPLAEMLAGGVALALGTDSRASNPDLSLFEEMRFVVRRHSVLSPRQILELGTICGARALGINEVGSLTPGKLANLAIVALADEDALDPHELLFADGARVTQTWLRGRQVSGAPSAGA